MNNESNTSTQNQFVLMESHGKPVNIKSRCWSTQAIYLNDICLVVELKLCSDNGEMEKITADQYLTLREDLYLILMSISQTALENALMRPVVGVLSEEGLPTDLKTEFKKWRSDQDWHRGAFMFFMETDDYEVKKRINDLLEFRVDAFNIQGEGDTEKYNTVKSFRFSRTTPDIEKITSKIQNIIRNMFDRDRSGIDTRDSLEFVVNEISKEVYRITVRNT